MKPLTQKIPHLDYEETTVSLKEIEKLLIKHTVSFKWVDKNLIIYPDNYLDTLDTSRFLNLLQVSNFDEFYESNDNEFEIFTISFEIDFKDEKNLVKHLISIKNNTFNDGFHWINASDIFFRRQENKKEQEQKNEYLNGLSLDDIQRVKKNLKKSIKHLDKMNCPNQQIQPLINQLEYLKSL